MLSVKTSAARAALIYGQKIKPCPACGSYYIRAQTPIQTRSTGSETAIEMLIKWACATKSGATPLEGPCFYMCFDCRHKGPAVDYTGRTSEEARQDPDLNREMKRLWNTQAAFPERRRHGRSDHQGPNSDNAAEDS